MFVLSGNRIGAPLRTSAVQVVCAAPTRVRGRHLITLAAVATRYEGDLQPAAATASEPSNVIPAARRSRWPDRVA